MGFVLLGMTDTLKRQLYIIREIRTSETGTWKVRMGTGICLILDWENGTCITGNDRHIIKTVVYGNR
jgi:hypothetical protein